jgi:hypothetical protein
MPFLSLNYNFGADLRNENPDLYRQLSEMYNSIAGVLNTKVSKYVTNGSSRPNVDAPANSQLNANYEIGDIYVRTDTNRAWIMTSRTTITAVTWTVIT